MASASRPARAVGALLALLSVALAFVVNVIVTRRSDDLLARELRESAAVLDGLRRTRVDAMRTEVRLLAASPDLIAAVRRGVRPAVTGLAAGWQRQLGAALVLVSDDTGTLLADVGTARPTGAIVAQQPAVRGARAGRETVSIVPQPDGLLQIVTAPIAAVPAATSAGTLTAGLLLDERLAAEVKQVTGSDVAFGVDGQVLASTLPSRYRPALSDLIRARGIAHVRLGREPYVALPLPLPPAIEGAPAAGGPVALVLRSREDQRRFLGNVRTALGAGVLVALALAALIVAGSRR